MSTTTGSTQPGSRTPRPWVLGAITGTVAVAGVATSGVAAALGL